MSNQENSTGTAIPGELVRSILKSQYHASLAMLREAIDRCPENVWTDRTHLNAFWQIAYHTLFFTHLYLQTEQSAFQPWERHQANVQYPDGIPGPPDPESALPLIAESYSKSDVQEYWDLCDAMVDDAVDAFDLSSPESGFRWYPIPKLEHQVVNIRHIQHGAAQLADRLRAAEGIGIRWAGSRQREKPAEPKG